MSYAKQGLSDRQAAAILLDRFTFGARPGDLERVLDLGPTAWLDAQLAAESEETELELALEKLPATRMTQTELARRYPTFGMVSAHARRYYDIIPPRDAPVMDFSVIREKLDRFAAEHGFERQEEAYFPQVRGQKLLRAALAENQLREVLTDFWQNHFYAGLGSFDARLWLISFEQTALRPHALGRFGELLEAAIAHPAMLALHSRSALPAEISSTESLMARRAAQLGADAAGDSATLVQRAEATLGALDEERDLLLARQFWAPTGPNEAFAEVLLGIYTLGENVSLPDAEVRDVARIFTGWTALPRGATPQWFAQDFGPLRPLGFVSEEGLLFRADAHDPRAKRALGRTYEDARGVDEGRRLLADLATHPATALHIAGKLTERFASEDRPDAIVEPLAAAFTRSGGDLRAILAELVRLPTFWECARRRSKVKSPFEYSLSAVRAAGARIDSTEALAEWNARMGQPLYGFLESTGYPEDSGLWLDPVSALRRVQFARALARGEISGLRIASDRAPTDAASRPGLERLAGPAFQAH